MRWFIAILAALVLVLQYRIWIAPDGAREVLQLRDSVATQHAENQKLQQRNRQLAAEVRDLKQGFGALEERARSELGLIAGNETYYQVVPPGEKPALPAPAPGDTALRTMAH
ncbi:MAG TPA: cell division protein FtsB [Steroidobacteraceae bacterium]|jgi:cell division protein FtsB|nr:cell division protein FtsB [Steroidobacteraceae bacterium]